MEKFLEIYSKYRDYILSFLLFIIFMVIQGVSFWYFSGEISSVKDTIKNKNVVSKKNETRLKHNFHITTIYVRR